MDDEIRKYLFDILECIVSIEAHFSGNKVFAEFQKNRTIRKAVERELETIGEAVNRIKKRNPTFTLTSAKGIIGLRNLIAHAYDAIDDTKIWAIVINHIPKLKTEVEVLL